MGAECRVALPQKSEIILGHSQYRESSDLVKRSESRILEILHADH